MTEETIRKKPFDKALWLKEVRTLEAYSRATKERIKKESREGKYPPSIPDANWANSDSLTVLYSIRAHYRGKLHMTKVVDFDEKGMKVSEPWTMNDQEHLIKSRFAEFLVDEEMISS